MDSKEIRIEILKISYRKDLQPDANIVIAEALEKYVVGVSPANDAKTPAGNPKDKRVR